MHVLDGQLKDRQARGVTARQEKHIGNDWDLAWQLGMVQKYLQDLYSPIVFLPHHSVSEELVNAGKHELV